MRSDEDRHCVRRQITRSAIDTTCVCSPSSSKRRSCPCIHELDSDDGPSSPSNGPGGGVSSADLLTTLSSARSTADWLKVVAVDYESRSDSALYPTRAKLKPDVEKGVSEFTESEPLLTTSIEKNETQI